jgi:HlyD family type I secretion membrane fusion protein
MELDAAPDTTPTRATARLGNALEFVDRLPPGRAPRVVLWSVCGMFALTLVWALVAELDIVAVAEGRLVPSTYSKIVQPTESGIVREILVRDGDSVAEGQVLIRLDPTLAGADSRSIAGEVALRRLTLRRIDSEMAGAALLPASGDDITLFAQVQAQGAARRQAYQDAVAQESAQRDRLVADLRAATETLNKLAATAPIVQEQAAAYEKLVSEGFFSPLAVQDKRREAINLQQDHKSQQAAVGSLKGATRRAGKTNRQPDEPVPQPVAKRARRDASATGEARAGSEQAGLSRSDARTARAAGRRRQGSCDDHRRCRGGPGDCAADDRSQR